MKNDELFRMLEFPDEVVKGLKAYEENRQIQLPDALVEKLMKRECWEEGVNDLKALVGEDADGFKILWELLDLVCRFTYAEYTKKQIADEIFIATMKFCTRFLEEHYRTYGVYKFVWAWWFPRQLSFNEFRVGALEYEFSEGEQREIYIHIPSDADMSKASVEKSLSEFYAFRNTYFPEWEEVSLVCDSWMLAPALKELLDDSSNILAFQNMFELDSANPEATWFMGFVFPGYEVIDERLPEKTSLQRRMKQHLLEGKQVGVAKGHLKK